MTGFYVIRHHHELLELWRVRDARGLRVVHVDFHDDLRGLVIDRRKGLAHRSGVFRADDAPLDEGNFLAHAVCEGRVRELQWVRGLVGGRAYDSGIVRYESDLAALPHRIAHALRRGPSVPLAFREAVAEEWDGEVEGTCLDIDWDCFAASELDEADIGKRFERFLETMRPGVPLEVVLCYSPDYVHPSRDAFLGAVKALADRFGCDPAWPGGDFADALPEHPPVPPPLSLKTRAIRFFRRKGLYSLGLATSLIELGIRGLLG